MKNFIKAVFYSFLSVFSAVVSLFVAAAIYIIAASAMKLAVARMSRIGFISRLRQKFAGMMTVVSAATEIEAAKKNKEEAEKKLNSSFEMFEIRRVTFGQKMKAYWGIFCTAVALFWISVYAYIAQKAEAAGQYILYKTSAVRNELRVFYNRCRGFLRGVSMGIALGVEYFKNPQELNIEDSITSHLEGWDADDVGSQLI